MRVKIDPKKARELLALNKKNRKMSKNLVQVYAADMAAARWPYNGDPIRISKSNILLDGQHRLQAIIDSGATIECELIEGLPDEVSMTIDGGRKRSAADVINILNGSSMLSSGLAAACKQSLNYLFGFHTSAKQSTPAIVEFLNNNPDISEKYRLARHSDKIIPAGLFGAVLFLGTRAVGMEKRAMNFVEPLSQGEGLEAGDPRLALRNAFVNARLKLPKGAHVGAQWSLVVIINSWNAYATGRELQFAKAVTGADGRKIAIPDIIGGPKYGSGLAGLKEVPQPTTKRRAVTSTAEREAAA